MQLVRSGSRGRRQQRRGPLLPGDRLGRAVDRADRRLLRAAAARSSRPSATRPSAGSGCGSSFPGRTATRRSSASPAAAIYQQLLDCGVEIHEYQPTMLHAKTMVVDGCWASVGTVNFDNRSFQLNDELTLCVFDGDVAARAHRGLRARPGRAERIEPERWSRRSRAQRACEKRHGAAAARALTAERGQARRAPILRRRASAATPTSAPRERRGSPRHLPPRRAAKSLGRLDQKAAGGAAHTWPQRDDGARSPAGSGSFGEWGLGWLGDRRRRRRARPATPRGLAHRRRGRARPPSRSTTPSRSRSAASGR